ncbi:tRNA (cytosine(38)-C(5))-methyltransferase, partial [Copidosoma floridanum]|uniref:tRNA (cytosine(38)-C(5))-methyltransferase n=1 Tax=Copidosoma floridanum TaxID=29053 RepID=UPI0006C9C848
FSGSTVDGTLVTSIDINTIANKVYKYNFPKTANCSRNIESLSIEEISKLDIDCILMSPPCQPFTRIGLKKDSSDNRCVSFLHLLTVIPSLKNLKYILLENVKGFETSQSRYELLSCLEKARFNYQEFILSPCQFGIPNSRHRYYLMAKKKDLGFIFDNNGLLTAFPDRVLKVIPKKLYKLLPVEKRTFNLSHTVACYKIKNILEENVDDKYLIPEKILSKHGHLLDIRTPESKGSCCFTKAYKHYVEGTGSVISPYLDIKMKESLKLYDNKEKLQYLVNLKLRYFTPREISRIMCFPENFKFPNELTDKQKYRLLGNSINIHVVSQLIYLLNYEDNVSQITCF